ncbi:hypothetical protein GPJ56_001508 [Histomonas meleagridis]|uniref:uncharacterized protein n=1 Tax=Histomonas meleagridis TaxID=135588 RepID=UPI00355AAFB4|nr:hypothetical protein GPJ56_001508 [Histomonas meleagridis]KAH0807014.1 hypothetical protein GO595_000190 [Histomonas meleagridis]
MYGGYLRRKEQSKNAWYKAHGQTPPRLCKTPEEKRRKMKIDTQAFTKTKVLHVFDPPPPQMKDNLSYWEVDGAGIEPVEFRNSLISMRNLEVMSQKPIKPPNVGKVSECSSPYQNDLMSFEAFETSRKELKHRAQHIVEEMTRVNNEWNRGPVENWFCLKDKKFTAEHCRFNELRKREIAKERKRRRRRTTTGSFNFRIGFQQTV